MFHGVNSSTVPRDFHESVESWRCRMEALDYSPTHVRKCVCAVVELARAADLSEPFRVSAGMLELWLDAQPSPKTAANKRSYVGGYLDYCVAHGLVAVNVARGVRTRRPRPGKGADVIRPDEMRRVIARLQQPNGDRRSTAAYRALAYRFLWATMIRVSELRQLTWSDVDEQGGVLRLSKDKARRADALPLSEDAIAVLQELRRLGLEGDRLFPVEISHHSVHKDFKAAGVSGKGAFHRLRKGAITACVEAGVSVALLAKLSRHANVSVLVQSYYVPADPTLRDAQKALRIDAA